MSDQNGTTPALKSATPGFDRAIGWQDFTLIRLARAHLDDGISQAEADLFESLSTRPRPEVLTEIATEMHLALGIAYGRGARDGTTYGGSMDRELMAEWLGNVLDALEVAKADDRPKLRLVR